MRVLGMISGTSHDGVDVALVDFQAEGDTLVGTVTRAGGKPYPLALRDRLVAALPPAVLPMARVCELDTLLGRYFAEVAVTAVAGEAVDLVCSHGQTVFHWVADGRTRGTLQLGQPAWIAEASGVPVLSDLRSADIAAGGQGAPLVPILDVLLLGDLSGTSAALNLGGIANMTILSGNAPPRAYDLGPANALIDASIHRMTRGRESYDQDGRRAASGTVDDGLLADLLQEPFYSLPGPKSTGKELFHADYVSAYLERHPGLDGADVIATLTALTAQVVAREIRRSGAQRVIASGGGVANPALMRALADGLPGIDWHTSDDFGAPSDTKEAIAFALIGYLSAHGIPGNVPSCTGAAGPRVLGTVTAGAMARPLPVASGARGRMPARLRLKQGGT